MREVLGVTSSARRRRKTVLGMLRLRSRAGGILVLAEPLSKLLRGKSLHLL